MHTHLAHEYKIAVDEINYVVDEKITFGIAVDEIKTTNFGLKTLFGGLTSLLKTQLRGGCVGGWVFEDSRDAEVEDQAPAASLVSQVVPKLHVAAPLACACRDSMLGADSVSSRAQKRGKGPHHPAC